jgi:rRNA maturation endonuclease Nob1
MSDEDLEQDALLDRDWPTICTGCDTVFKGEMMSYCSYCGEKFCNDCIAEHEAECNEHMFDDDGSTSADADTGD